LGGKEKRKLNPGGRGKEIDKEAKPFWAGSVGRKTN